MMVDLLVSLMVESSDEQLADERARQMVDLMAAR